MSNLNWQNIETDSGHFVPVTLISENDPILGIIEYEKLQAKNNERERIIKLLLETPEGLDAILACTEFESDGAEIIALIKGETE